MPAGDVQIPFWFIWVAGVFFVGLGAVVGGFGVAWRTAFKFGSVFTEATNALNAVNTTIKDIQDKHEKHEEKNEHQISALWKVVDLQGKQIIVLEHECKNFKERLGEFDRDIEKLKVKR